MNLRKELIHSDMSSTGCRAAKARRGGGLNDEKALLKAAVTNEKCQLYLLFGQNEAILRPLSVLTRLFFPSSAAGTAGGNTLSDSRSVHYLG